MDLKEKWKQKKINIINAERARKMTQSYLNNIRDADINTFFKLFDIWVSNSCNDGDFSFNTNIDDKFQIFDNEVANIIKCKLKEKGYTIKYRTETIEYKDEIITSYTGFTVSWDKSNDDKEVISL